MHDDCCRTYLLYACNIMNLNVSVINLYYPKLKFIAYPFFYTFNT
jgi:hypothetical protein